MKPRRWIGRSAPVALLFVVLLVIWYVVVRLLSIPEYILPNPIAVAVASVDPSIPWVSNFEVTALEVIEGFVLSGVIGVVLGAMIAWSPLGARTILPFLVFVNTLPKVALAPLFLLWLGYGVFPNALIAALIGFFPVVINSAVGLSQTPEEMLDLGQVFGAPKWRVFVKIRIPGALPYIISALKVSATSCVVGAIIGEFIASQRGLGSVILNTQTSMNTPVAFGAIVWISVLGLAVYGAVGLVGRWVAPWAEGSPS